MKILKSLITIILILISNFSYSQEINQKQIYKGKCSVEQVGSCAMVVEPFDIELKIKIDNITKTFTAIELWENEDGIFEEQVKRKWTGQVLNQQALRFKLEVVELNCNGKLRTEILHFVSVINCEKGTCEMKLENNFAMCPTSNCIFKIKYDLKLFN